MGQLALAGVSAFGALQQGEAARAEAESQRNIALFNAQVAEQEAEAEKARAAFAQERQAKEAAQRKSKLRADIAQAGGTGSPVAADLAAELGEELELENLLIGFEGAVRAQRLREEAKLLRVQGKLFRQRGKAQQRASRVRAGQSVLKGFGSTAGGFGGTA